MYDVFCSLIIIFIEILEYILMGFKLFDIMKSPNILYCKIPQYF
jgi:hypothetical protein